MQYPDENIDPTPVELLIVDWFKEMLGINDEDQFEENIINES